MTSPELKSHPSDHRFAPPQTEELVLDERRRPFAIWVIAGFYLVAIALNIVMLVLMGSGAMGARMQDFVFGMSFVDIVGRYYPSMIILIGVVLLLRLNRWCILPFAALSGLGVFDLATRRPISAGTPDEMVWLLWGPKIFMDLLPVCVVIYCLHLWRKGVLR
jgi:hypothetical protein